MNRKSLLLLLIFMAATFGAEGAIRPDTLRLTLHYPCGGWRNTPAFGSNASHLQHFGEVLDTLTSDSTLRLVALRIRAGASPEGNTDYQKTLSARRAKDAASAAQRLSLRPLPRAEVRSVGIDWEGLQLMVEASQMPYRAEALDILRHTPEWISRGGRVVDGRKRQLQMLHGGEVWRYMEQHFFADLRRADVELIYTCRPSRTTSARDTVVISRRDTIVVMHYDTVYLADRPRQKAKPLHVGLKTNLLYDAALVPNIGIEFWVGRGWSIGANWMYAWWHSNKRHYYWRTYGGELALRKYFGSSTPERPLTGHHLGLYGQMLTYDFETGKTGYLSKLSYGAGIEYGYSLPVGRRLNLDFSIGVGYLGGSYEVYDPQQECYVWKQTRQRHWIGPTKAEIALVWMFGNGNYKLSK